MARRDPYADVYGADQRVGHLRPQATGSPMPRDSISRRAGAAAPPAEYPSPSPYGRPSRAPDHVPGPPPRSTIQQGRSSSGYGSHGVPRYFDHVPPPPPRRPGMRAASPNRPPSPQQYSPRSTGRYSPRSITPERYPREEHLSPSGSFSPQDLPYAQHPDDNDSVGDAGSAVDYGDYFQHALNERRRMIPQEDVMSPARKLTEAEVDHLVDRLHMSAQTVEQRNAKLRAEAAQKELDGCTFKPEISKRSQKMLVQKEREESETMMTPQQQRSKKDQARWSHRQQKWNETRMRKREEQKMQLEEDEECTFRPELNQKSVKIFRQFRQTAERPHERLLREHSERCAKKEIEHEYLKAEQLGEVFQPRISPKAERLQMQTGVFTRLYGDALTRKAIKAEDPQMSSPLGIQIQFQGDEEAVDSDDDEMWDTGAGNWSPDDVTPPPPRQSARMSTPKFSPAQRTLRPPPTAAVQEINYRPEHEKVINYLRAFG